MCLGTSHFGLTVQSDLLVMPTIRLKLTYTESGDAAERQPGFTAIRVVDTAAQKTLALSLIC